MPTVGHGRRGGFQELPVPSDASRYKEQSQRDLFTVWRTTAPRRGHASGAGPAQLELFVSSVSVTTEEPPLDLAKRLVLYCEREDHHMDGCTTSAFHDPRPGDVPFHGHFDNARSRGIKQPQTLADSKCWAGKLASRQGHLKRLLSAHRDAGTPLAASLGSRRPSEKLWERSFRPGA
ncbi:hypothetical protein G7046_g7696 [Stylonectria norvegica]|nr:hypothetical protein G7046_g7696 [Stylonectria norvegica]